MGTFAIFRVSKQGESDGYRSGFLFPGEKQSQGRRKRFKGRSELKVEGKGKLFYTWLSNLKFVAGFDDLTRPGLK